MSDVPFASRRQRAAAVVGRAPREQGPPRASPAERNARLAARVVGVAALLTSPHCGCAGGAARGAPDLAVPPRESRWAPLPPSFGEEHDDTTERGGRVRCVDSTTVADAAAWLCGTAGRPSPACMRGFPMECLLIRDAAEARRFGVPADDLAGYAVAWVGRGPLSAWLQSPVRDGIFRAPRPVICGGGTNTPDRGMPLSFLVRIPHVDAASWQGYSQCNPAVP